MTEPRRVRIRMLGTGTSTGVPVIGCKCPTCTSRDFRDTRLRCSCYIQAGGVHIVIDVGPDFRQQAMAHRVEDVDAVLITHHHFDHVVGLDDLRPYMFYNRVPIPCYTLKSSADFMRNMFSYIFSEASYPGAPRLEMHDVKGPFQVTGRTDKDSKITVTPIPAVHGSLDVLGYRIGNFAYLTDISDVPFASRGLLEGLDVLVLDGLRDKPHPMHMTIERSIEIGKEIGAKQTWFTHIAHDLTHAEIEARMPSGIGPAFDGLEFDVEL